MGQLTRSLEVDLQRKDELSLKLPQLNYMCPKSMLAWLHIRTLIQSTGLRFLKRQHLYMVFFFITLVLAFVFVGDGLRDAADPYADTKK